MRPTKLAMLFVFIALSLRAAGQEAKDSTATKPQKFYVVSTCEYKGERIPLVTLPTHYVYQPLKFKNRREFEKYQRMVYDVKKTLPIAREIRNIIIETYEFIQMLPTEKERKKHLDKLEKGLKEQYTPRMKKLSLRQGKILIKLIDRECNQTSYQLVKVFMGSFKAGFYQTFASMFGASLKKEFDPDGEDFMLNRIATEVERGQL